MKRPVLYYYALGNDVTAFTTTRQGGVGEGRYASFNVNPYCGDRPEHVAENRRLLCSELGLSDRCLVFPHQVHETMVRQIDRALLSSSSEDIASALEGVDALVTNERGCCIGVSTADCVPILLYDPVHEAVAAVHAGWRGTVKRIAEKAVESMTSCYGSRARDLRAVIGPSISASAFEVGDEVYETFLREGFDMERIAQRMEKWHIDLWMCNRLQLERMGVAESNIFVAGICTFSSHHQWFSARRLGINSGRLLTAIMLKP